MQKMALVFALLLLSGCVNNLDYNRGEKLNPGEAVLVFRVTDSHNLKSNICSRNPVFLTIQGPNDQTISVISGGHADDAYSYAMYVKKIKQGDYRVANINYSPVSYYQGGAYQSGAWSKLLFDVIQAVVDDTGPYDINLNGEFTAKDGEVFYIGDLILSNRNLRIEDNTAIVKQELQREFPELKAKLQTKLLPHL